MSSSAAADPLNDSIADFLRDLEETPAPESTVSDTRTSATTALIDSLLAEHPSQSLPLPSQPSSTPDKTGTEDEEKPTIGRNVKTMEPTLSAAPKTAKTTTPPKKVSTPPNYKRTAASTSQRNKGIKSTSPPRTRKSPTSSASAGASAPVTTPRSHLLKPVPTRDGLTMYERSMLQMEERQRKLKALQDKLHEQYTFQPRSNPSSRSTSPLAASPAHDGVLYLDVFERLYHAETKAYRAQRPSPKSITTNTSSSSTTPRGRVKPLSNRSVDMDLTPARLEELAILGQQKLRARPMNEKVCLLCTSNKRLKKRKCRQLIARRLVRSTVCSSIHPSFLSFWFFVFSKEEEEARRKRLEEEELAKCSFKPNTKWHLAADRRKQAKEAAFHGFPSSDEKKDKALAVRLHVHTLRGKRSHFTFGTSTLPRKKAH